MALTLLWNDTEKGHFPFGNKGDIFLLVSQAIQAFNKTLKLPKYNTIFLFDYFSGVLQYEF